MSYFNLFFCNKNMLSQFYESSLRSFVDNSFEYLEEFRFGNFAILIFVDSIDQTLNFLGRCLSTCIHLFQSSIDKVGDFGNFKSVTSISIEIFENCINCGSELLVGIGHLEWIMKIEIF